MSNSFGKDLVSGCSTDQNALGRFAKQQMQDKSNWQPLIHSQQMHNKPFQTFHEKQQLAMSDPSISNLVDSFEKWAPHHSGAMLNNNNNLRMGSSSMIDEFEKFSLRESQSSTSQRGMPSQLLDRYLKSFIHSNITRQDFQHAPLPDLGLNENDKMKLHRRALALTRHLHPGQSDQYIHGQANALLLPIDKGASFQQNMMLREFESFQSRQGPPAEWDQILKQQERDMMAMDFQRFRQNAPPPEEWNQILKEQQDQQRFLEEWEGKRPVERFPESGTKSITQIAKELSEQGKQDPKLSNSAFFNLMNDISEEKKVFTDSGIESQHPQQSMVDEFSQFQFNQDNQAESEWNSFLKMFGNQGQSTQNTQELYDEWNKVNGFNDMEAFMRQYDFTAEDENPYVNEANPYKRGMELFNQGHVPQSILAFEASLLREENKNSPENAEKWFRLGLAHQECDKDGKAIACLIRSTEADPSNDQAYMALTVSYTNEVGREQALDTLKKWIKLNPKYKNIQTDAIGPQASFQEYHMSITRMFLEAAASSSTVDPEVQIGLGLLYNLNMDYAKAVDCFRSALRMRPDDYALWNKLGATLANSNRFSEALDCYFRALSIKPSYVRARANLGISYMGLKEHKQACKYFLSALSMHTPANHLWGHLQMCFMALGREDLVERSIMYPDPEYFKDEEFN